MARTQSRQRNTNLPGSLYQRNRRWWWKVHLPGEDKPKSLPLKPTGSRYATTDYAVAVECAKCLLQQHLFDRQEPLKGDVRTIPDLVHAYMEFARSYYVGSLGKPTREPLDIKYALVVLLDCFPSLCVDEFGPLRLKAVREAMIEKNWCRTLINKRIEMIRRMFKWAVSEQIVSPVILHGLQSVTGLKRGRTRAK
ncbi:MAG: hypothetical protein ACYSQY_01535, partial [Planctomycetota bacterium]